MSKKVLFSFEKWENVHNSCIIMVYIIIMYISLHRKWMKKGLFAKAYRVWLTLNVSPTGMYIFQV